jgi:hypothetical protein
MWRVTGLLLLLGLPVAGPGQENKAGPALSPDLMVVVGFQAARGELHLKLNQYREQEVQELAVGPGVTLKAEKVIGPFQAERFLKLKDCKVLEASGKVLAPADYAERFKAGAVVVVTTDGNPPARVFLQLLRPETTIVVGPAVKLDPRNKLPPAPPAAA